jgi:hypothetical protein
LINRYFHHAQFFIDVKQKKKQSMQIFNVYLNNLKSQLISYIKAQRVTHFFYQAQIEAEIDFDQLSRLVNHKKKMTDLDLAIEEQSKKNDRRSNNA